jgi:acyl transferase domain-containing protein
MGGTCNGSGSAANEPIAIIGLSCKFAGDATNPKNLWKLLADGKSAWTEIPSSRFNAEGSYHPDPEKLSTVRLLSYLLVLT